MRRLAQLLLENEEIFRSSAEDRGDVVAGVFERLGSRQRDRRADAAADDDAAAVVLDLGWFSERTGDVEDRVAFPQLIQQRGCLADGLHDDRDGSALGVR